MAIRLPDGSIQMSDGRLIYANSLINAQDLIEILPLFIPPPVWPFISGGGGGGSGSGTPGARGADGAAGTDGADGNQGFQGPGIGNPGPQGNQGNQGNQGVGGAQGNQGGAGPQGLQGNQGNQGVLGNQGNQGVAGTGVQGPQGNIGVQGNQGNQGAVGAGVQGNQGNQGIAGTGTAGAQGPQGLLSPDIFAATRVVSLIAGDGTDLTIAAAIAALPAEGGKIYVKQGTYPQAATLTIPAGKPVVIAGSGSGTIIDLGANAIAAFTIPTGAATNTQVTLSDFKVLGTEVANQTLCEYADANGLTELHINRVNTVGVQKTINVTAGSIATSTPGQDDVRIHMTQCRIRPISTGTSVMLSNPSIGYPRVWMNEVEFIGDSLFAIPVAAAAPLFGRIASDDYFGDLYMDGCEMSIGGAGVAGESDFAVLETVDTTIWNNDPTNTLVTYFTFGSFTGSGPGTLNGSTFVGINFEVIEGNVFQGCQFTDCNIDIFGPGTVVSDCNFLQVISPYVSAFVIMTQDENAIIHANRFQLGTPPAQVVQCEVSTTVTDNDWSPITTPGANGVLYLNNAVSCIVVGNRFPFAPTSGPPLVEVSGSNYYHANSQLWNNGGAVIVPVVPTGGASEVEGMLDMNGVVSTGAGTIVAFRYRNPFGLAQVKGYIENIGANNYTLTETWITQNLGTFTTVTTPVVPTTKNTLDPFNLPAGLAPNSYQVIEYNVSITVIAGAISAHKYFAGPSGVSNA